MSRKEKEIRTNAMRILDRMKIPYKVLQYEVEHFEDGVQIADIEGVSRDASFKTLVMKGKSGEYFVFVLPVEKEVDLKAAARAVGEKSVEMIAVKDITAVTGYVRGGCSPIGMKKEYRTAPAVIRYAFCRFGPGRICIVVPLFTRTVIFVSDAVIPCQNNIF